MKNILLSLLFVLSFTILSGQVSKTINLSNAGTLSAGLTSEELNSVTNLTITGNIDARDFKTMRDLMLVLAEIDLSGTTILGYEGLEGTSKSGNTIYPSNTVPENAFESKPTLKNIILPNSTEEISLRAFLYCRQLLSATLPSSLLKINDQAFGWCNGLISILLPESLTYIGYNAFATTNLTEINIPQAVGYIGDVVFFQCRKLLSINVSALNEKYSSVDGVLFNKDQTILIAYPGGKTALDYTFPSSVKKIAVRSFEGSKLSKINLPDGILDVGFEAFTNMYGLKEISIPSSISKIEAGAFAYNANVVSISVDRSIPLTFGGSYGVFDGINKSSCRLNVPFGSKAAYQAADQWKDFQNIVEMKATSSSKTVNLTTAGTLSTVLSSSELASITKLTITGNIDARDFKTMRDLMPLLAEIDLSGATIVAYNPAGDNVNPANTIPPNAFYNISALTGKQSLTTCILPSSATTIGTSAFSNCLNLSAITIPLSVTEISSSAFSFCKKLESVNIPKNVTTIGNQAFYFCNASFIVDAENPNYSSVDGVLFDKSKTTLIQCPTSKAGVYTIPLSVTNLGVNAFSGCSSLFEIIVPPLVKEMGYQTFSNCSGLVKINIPSSVHTIQPYAFEFCRKLSSITIPSSVTQIGGAAFRGCIELSSIYALNATPVNLNYSSDVFKDVDKTTCILYVPSGSENLYANASQWSEFSNIQSIPVVSKTINLTSPGTLASLLTDTELASVNNLTLTGTIDARDFKTMRDLMPALTVIDLSAVTIAEYIGTEGTAGTQLTTYPALEIPRNALINRANIARVSIPVSATTIGRSAFNNCDGLTQVTFGPNSQLTTVGYLSFAYCDGLTEIQIPSGVTLIDYGAFRQCTTLVTCNLPESVKTIGSAAFYQCYKLKNFSIPQIVETIGEFAFYSCKEILNFNIPASAILVGRGTFIGATGTVMVAENNPGYSSLDGVFYDKNITLLIYCPPSTTGHFTIPITVTTIAVDAFYNCSQITSFNLPEGLTTLEDWAFENCNSITSLTLPASVISIGNQAFYSCFGLSSFIVNNPVPVNLSSKTDVFLGIDKSTCTLFVPAGSESLYAAAVQWNEFTKIVASNQSPVANAGTDQTVNEGILVTLNGTASSDTDGNTLTYFWTAPNGIIISSATAGTPTFTAPEVSKDTEFIFSLKVNDGTVDSQEDLVIVVVKQVNKTPVADAGIDQAIDEGATAILDGSLSSDADQDNLTYKWTAPVGITLSSESAQKPSFIAPEVTQDTRFTFYLVVNDGFTDSPTDQVLVTVKQVNKAPVADAGADQTIEEGSTVTLDGSLSSDADGDSITYKWTTPDGITLSSASAQKPTFIAPEVAEDTQFTFYLVVNDGFADSPAGQVVVTVKQANQLPVADAGADQTIEEGATVTLDGSLSSDANGDSITYKWTASDGITLSSVSAQKPTFVAPEVAEDTQFTFYLVVNDGFADSPVSQVVITVKQANQQPVANAGADQNVKTGDKVVLNGSGSFDPDQDSLVYFWTSLSGITLNSASDPLPFFMAPVTKNETDLIFTLTVSDGSALSKTDTVIITVENKSSVISVITFFDGTAATPEQLRYELYKETNGNFTKVAATFSTENNTALFNVEAGNWIILAIPVDPETNFIPTYFGNGVTWDEAGIITINGDEVIDLEINCRKTETEPAGEYSIEGFVYQAEGTKSCVVLSNATGNNPVPGTKVLLYQENKTTPIRTTFTDNEGKYIFSNLNPAEYKVIVDIPGFDQVDVWNIKLDSVSVSAVYVNFTVVTSLGVITDIPETEYRMAIYPNPTTGILHLETENWPQNSKAEVFNYDGRLVFQTLILNSSSVIDLSDKPDGVYILNISSDNKKETAKIIIRK